MTRLLFDPEQHFTCSQCGHCCRRWEIVLTQREVDAYKEADAGRWFRAGGATGEGDAEPFERIRRTKLFRIRQRADGACGFLSAENRCRIHEELGERRKPFTCRMFPHTFYATTLGPVATTSFSCPTTVANEGAALGEQSGSLKGLAAEWAALREPKPSPVFLARSRVVPEPALQTLREVLREMLDRPAPSASPGADPAPDLRMNVGRMARTLEDLSRYRVLRLEDERLAEYMELTTRFAASSDAALEPRPPSSLARLFSRGFLFVVAATRLQLENRVAAGLKLGLRLRLFRLLAHVHGLGPGLAGVDVAAARAHPVDMTDPRLHGIAHNYLRSTLRTLGTGRRSVVDELGVAVAFLNAACSLAASRAARSGAGVDEAVFGEALMEAVDLTHADAGGFVGRVLTMLAGGAEALYLFEAGRPARSAA